MSTRLANLQTLVLLLLLPGCPTEVTPDTGIGADVPELDSRLPAADTGLPDAPVALCEVEGATRTEACGSCGLHSQQCTSGVWTAVGPCIGEGECAGGTLETRSTATCAEETRICTSACSWSAWDETMPSTGECAIGAMRTIADGCSPGRGRVELCSDTCGWVDTGVCEDACGGTPRTSPSDAVDICIPAGPFMRGRDTTGHRPVREITLSAFYIDRYPVTVRRYAECVASGSCTPPAHPDGRDAFLDPSWTNHPVNGVSWDQASAFCAWDGARRLPSEAEWEKAARGPSPRGPRFPWGDTADDCSILQSRSCAAARMTEGRVAREYDGLPLTASFYGVEMMEGGGFEWTLDLLDWDYYGTSSDINPVNDAPGTRRVTRGSEEWAAWPNLELALRGSALVTAPPDYRIVIRCVRPVTPEEES